MLLPSLLKSGDQVYQKVIKQLYQKMLLLNLLITLLLEEGRIARHFHYVESGMLRQYYYKNGHDITEHFSCEDDLVFCIISLFRQEPTRLMIEAIEPTVVSARIVCFLFLYCPIIQENFRMGPYGIPEQSRLLAIRNCQGTL